MIDFFCFSTQLSFVVKSSIIYYLFTIVS